MFYSASHNGFFTPDIHHELFIERANAIESEHEAHKFMVPDPEGVISDAVEITQDEYIYLLNQQSEGKVILSDELGYPKAVDFKQTEQDIATIEHAWVESELMVVQVELMYHWTDDQRATSTLDAWKLYARQLRDYTTTDDQGTPSIRGESRPAKPI
ncbi:hypothetical protein ACI8HA_003181 [Vibrio cholerae]